MLVEGERLGSSFNLLQVEIQFSQHHLLKRLSFSPTHILGIFIKNQIVESGVWEAYENLIGALICQIMCRLGLAQPPSCRRGQGQNAAQLLFPICLCPESKITGSPVPDNYTVTCVPPSPLPRQPTWLQLSACLSFLNFPSLPVMFLGLAHAGHQRWLPNRDLTMGELEAWDEQTVSEKRVHNRK
jgi:hypothetical protein